MAELDPSISLPLLRGLARSTGYTKQQLENDNTKPSATHGKSSSSSPNKSSLLNQPATTPISHQKSPQPKNDNDDDDGGKNNDSEQPLPIKLHHLLSSNNNNENAVHWMPHGRSFKVCNYSALLSLLNVSPVGGEAEGGVGTNDGEQHHDSSDNDKVKNHLTKLLKCWGFQQFESGVDMGTFYHEDFLRCHLDKCVESTTLLMYDEGRGSSSLSRVDEEEEDNNDDEDEEMEDVGGEEDDEEPAIAAAASAAGGGNNDVAPTDEETTFMAITACTDVTIARQYLEMSGNQLEMAVSLFMDVGGGGAAAAGLSAAAGSTSSSSPAARSSRTNTKSSSKKKKSQPRRSSKKTAKTKDEPDFYAMTPMPLIIPSKKPKLVLPAQKLVQSALKEYCAFRVIRRALLIWIQKRRSVRLQNQHEFTQTNIMLQSLPFYNKSDFHHCHHGTRHFLFQSLLHPSLPVRRCAARMIMHNLHRSDDNCSSGGVGGDSNDGGVTEHHKNKIWDLQEVLIVLLHGVMFQEPPYQIESFAVGNNNGPEAHQPKSSQGGGDPAIQLMAMLLALVCDGGFSNIIVEHEVKELVEQQKYCAVGGQTSSSLDALGMGMFLQHGDDILCQSLLRELSSDCIESFVASGGLRWACGSIVRLCHLLVHGDEGDAAARQFGRQGSESDDSQYDRNVERMNEITAQTIQTRLLLLIDLVYKLVLFGTVPAAVDGRDPFAAGDDKGKEIKDRKKMLEKAIARRKENREKVSRMLEGSSGGTSRTSSLSALRQSLRSTAASGGIGSPQLSSEKRAGNANDIGGGGDPPNPSVVEENRRRKDRRKSSLERVHQIFWSSTLPAAKCIPASTIESDSQDDNSEEAGGNFTPLACLVAAYEILRSKPASKSSLVTNGQLRGLEKSIATLARLVDPAAASAVVVSDPDIAWGTELPQNTPSKKRDRASSHASQDSQRSSSSPSRASRAQQMADSRAKRARTSSGNVSSLLERLSEVEAPSANRSSGPSAASSGGAAARASLASQESSSSNSLFSSRYRSTMESMLRGATGNASPSREGSLGRILASSGASSRLAGAGGRPGSSYSARSTSTAGSPNRSIRARAVASGQVDEWRELEADEDEAMDLDMCDDEEENPTMEHDSDGSDSVFEEVIDIHEDGDGAMNDGDDNGEDDDGEGSCDDEDTDEELFEGNGQFDDAVINMEEINVNDSSQREDQHPHSRNNPHRQSVAARSPTSRAGAAPSPVELAAQKKDREHAYLRAAMQLLESQYPDSSRKGMGLVGRMNLRRDRPHSIFAHPTAILPSPLLTINAEVSLLRSICNIVKPPRKPLNLKIFMRRAPTQEEFFRGSLSRNPISLSSLKAGTSNPQGSGAGDERRSSGPNEPRVSDLRLHIAKDLQMEDSAELLELLVANKILDINLNLRVVQQVLWRKYVEENATSASSLVAGAGPGHQMISTGSGLSMIFSSAGLTGRGRNGTASDDNAVLASFPPMVVTYRLAGVDGEATEDKVEPEDLEDPEAPASQNSPEARERRMEKEFGITRIVTKKRGIPILLASIQDTISGLLRRIRRDEVARRRQLQHGSLDSNADGNLTREGFAKSPPCPGLLLLRHCANLTSNRKKLLANRAPTILLRLLLDILNSMNRSSPGRQRSSTIDFSTSAMDADSVDNISLSGSVASSVRERSKGGHTEGNPTTQALQDIIELLASDISAELSDDSNKMSVTSSFADLSKLGDQQSGDNEDDRTLPLVLKSLHSTDLSPPLRKVIAKLLPFLTYGQVSQSKELASYFARYISVESLGRVEEDSILMNTFVETAINLPPVAVCDNLRTALIRNDFVGKVRAFLMEGAPLHPPPWSSSLYPKSAELSSDKDALKEEWRQYFDRPGLDNAFQILTGLCSKHASTQQLLSNISEDGNSNDDDGKLSLLTLCHWMESTSDNTSSSIKNPNGILAETLLDALKEGNESASEKICAIRKKTRDRKREIAEERRNKALKGMSAFGPMTGSSAASSASAGASSSTDNRSASMFASVFGGLSSSLMPSSAQPRTRASSAKSAEAAQPAKPAWMAEMEALDDEKGVTCAVCQEGRTFQPSELLGLYAYMKKVTIAAGQGGATGDIDGTVMLLSLPMSLPRSSVEAWFRKARVAANALEGSAHAITAMSAANSTSSGSSGRSNHFITTVSAGNAIHCSCHSKAKAADRNHPKAPKSEWEGASLRNSRVTCNVILPLVSTKTSSVPLMSVENALADVNNVMANTLGVRPKSTLWGCLHDIRFLLLRMAYGEALNADCGGGSSSSNFLLALYQLYTADMFAANAEHDESPEVSKHARNLSYGFLLGEDIVDLPTFDRNLNSRSKRLERGVAESAPMAALCSILFYNVEDETGSGTKNGKCLSPTGKAPSPTRQWEVNKDIFLAGLIRCAGHRHSLGLTDSGCATSKGLSAGRKNVEKTRSFADWRKDDIRSQHKTAMIDDYGQALRPMITLYAVFDQLSREFVVNDDESTEATSERLAARLESCYKAGDIEELLQVAEIAMSRDLICKYFEKGCTS